MRTGRLPCIRVGRHIRFTRGIAPCDRNGDDRSVGRHVGAVLLSEVLESVSPHVYTERRLRIDRPSNIMESDGAPLDEHGLTLEQGAETRQKNMTAHSQLETLLFASSIERRALRTQQAGDR